jgi:hypothetical protein
MVRVPNRDFRWDVAIRVPSMPRLPGWAPRISGSPIKRLTEKPPQRFTNIEAFHPYWVKRLREGQGINAMSSGNVRRRQGQRKKKGSRSKLAPQSDTPAKPQKPAQLELAFWRTQAPHRPQEPQSRFQSQVRFIVGRPIVLLVALLATFGVLPLTIWGIWGIPWSTDPEIRAATDSYSSPFTVRNTSGWFSMTNMLLACTQGTVIYSNPNWHVGDNVSIRPTPVKFPILPKAHATLPCTGFSGLGPPVSETMVLEISYTMRWHSHAISEPRTITVLETYEHGKWIKGDII